MSKVRTRLKRVRKRNWIVGTVCLLLVVGIITLGVRMSENDHRPPGYEATLKVMGADGTLPGVEAEDREEALE